MNTLNILSAIATVGVNAVVNSNTVASTPKKKRSRYSQRDGESFVAWQTRLAELRSDARERVRKHREEQRNAVSDLATQMLASVKVIAEDDANGKTFVESDNVVKALDLSHDDVVRIAAASLLSPGETREVIVSQLTAKFSTKAVSVRR
jgi:ribosome-binding protein aMBF1 (putative translation factor)